MTRARKYYKRTPLLSFILLYTLISSLFLSCSNSTLNSSPIDSDNITLKELTSKKEKELLWTRELESVRLTRDYSKNPIVTKNFTLSPASMAVAPIPSPLIYPLLPGFGSLDSSAISTDLKAFTDSFCSSLSTWDFASIKCDDSALFSLILFKHDIEDNWEATYNTPFPLDEEEDTSDIDTEETSEAEETSKEISETEENTSDNKDNKEDTNNESEEIKESNEEQSKESEETEEEPTEPSADTQEEEPGDTPTEPTDNTEETSEDAEPPTPPKKKIYDTWTYGVPFFDDVSIELPIRFTGEHGTLDITVYIKNDESDYKIELLEIEKMQ